MKILVPTLLGLLLLTAAFPCLSQGQADPEPAEADTTETASAILLPVAGYTPETQVMLGVTWLRFFQLGDQSDGSRASSASPVAVITTRKQIIALVMVDLNWGAGRHHFKATPQFQRFPDKFYGIGRQTRDSDEEDFTPELFALDLLYERRVLNALAVGATFHTGGNRLVETQAGGLLDSGAFAGTGSTVLTAPGIRLAWDTRDNTWSARSGSYLQAQTAFYRKAVGSDFQFTEYALDLRRYWTLGRRGSLACQVTGKIQNGRPPFYALTKLGGLDGLRGYLSGRYLDQVQLMARAEWRSPEFWKGLSCAAFTGVGDVAPTLDQLTSSAHFYTLGFGFRYLIDPEQQVKVRIDYGFGHDSTGFYFGLGEAF